MRYKVEKKSPFQGYKCCSRIILNSYDVYLAIDRSAATDKSHASARTKTGHNVQKKSFLRGLPFQMHYRVHSFVSRWRHNSQICGVNFPKRTKSAVELCKILRVVTTEIVGLIINSARGRLTLYPAGMHCPGRIYREAIIS